MKEDSKLKIAVLRGGSLGHAGSISGGYGVLDSLARIGFPSFDVYIDEEGIWYAKGIVIEPHAAFAQVDGYIDTTEDLPEKYQELAKRMGVKKLLWDHKEDYHKDRENVYRLLRQKGIAVPDTKVVRTANGMSVPYLHTVWKTLHTPYLVRPLERKATSPSKLISSFDDFKKTAMEHTEKGEDFHVLTYRSAPTISTAVVPNYRGEDLYVPLSVTTLLGKRETPSEGSKIVIYRSHENEYSELKGLLSRVYDALMLEDPALIDVIKTPQGFLVVEVQTKPSLREEGRFMQSLNTTGVEIAHYLEGLLHDRARS